MNNEIAKLAPQGIWKHFAEICDIPHPSYFEAKIREYLVDFAKAHKLEYVVDGANNVIIRKPATKGQEGRRTITLQAHVDMVPQANSDKAFDFKTDPILPYIDGEWVKADGTTLGSDNGIGVAAMLAVLASTDIKHGAIEAFFTATEEAGMEGAFGLKVGELQGSILLNLDTERAGELCVGCAGGLDLSATMRYDTFKIDKSFFSAFRIEVKGLKGGHSGIDIPLQRANANKLVARFLKDKQERIGIHLADFWGGNMRNAIPREARVWVVVPTGKEAALKKAVRDYEKLYSKEYYGVEEGISFKAVPAEKPAKVLDFFDQMDLVDAIVGCPNGVMRMSTAMEGLVETSTNLAIVRTERGKASIQCLLRSSVDSRKEELATMMRTVFELADFDVKTSGGYSGWNPNMESPILATMRESYKKLFGDEVEVVAVHAGLECGIIGGVYPDMDMISFGPTIMHPHSPDEKVNIPSVDKFFKLLVYSLETAPMK